MPAAMSLEAIVFVVCQACVAIQDSFTNNFKNKTLFLVLVMQIINILKTVNQKRPRVNFIAGFLVLETFKNINTLY